MTFSQEAAEGEGNGVANEGNQTFPELHKNLSAHPASQHWLLPLASLEDHGASLLTSNTRGICFLFAPQNEH